MNRDDPFQILILDGNGGCEFLERDKLEDVIESPDRLIWVHLNYSQTAAKDWVMSAPWLDTVIKKNLLDDDSRPRSITHQNGLFLSLRGVNLNPGSDPEDMVAVRVWATERCIISSNRRKLISLEDIKESLLNRTGPCSAADFITRLIDQLAFRAEVVIEQLEDTFEQVEDDLSTIKNKEQRAQISDLRRQAIRLKRYFAPQKEALTHLLNDSPPWLAKSDKIHVRESINKFNRYLEELDSIRDRAIVAQEELLGKLSELLNQRMYALTLVATLFLPLGFLTGLLGINVGGIPGAQNQYGFLISSMVIFLFAIGMILFLKFKKWF
jgi:zinc transporter